MRNLLEIFLHKIYQYGCLCVKKCNIYARKQFGEVNKKLPDIECVG